MGNKQTLLYLVQCAETGPIKIGTTYDMVARFVTLQVGNPVRLDILAVVPGSVALEREIQKRFAADWLRGEWFWPSPELIEYAASLPTELAERIRLAFGPCVRCGDPGYDRRVDKTDKRLVISLCRRCAMQGDGRLERWMQQAYRPRAPSEPRACEHCRRVVKITRNGLCGACSEYLRRHGVHRSLDKPKPFCLNCGSDAGAIKRQRCPACYMFLRRHGRDRTLKTVSVVTRADHVRRKRVQIEKVASIPLFAETA